MVVRLRAALRRPQVLLVNSVAAWPAECTQVEGATTEAEVEAETGTVKASIDQLS